MKVRIAARVFVAGRLLGEETIELEPNQIDSLLPQIARQQAKLVGDRPFMVELEFLDEPNANQRFFRFGTDPSGMVLPIATAIKGSSLEN